MRSQNYVGSTSTRRHPICATITVCILETRRQFTGSRTSAMTDERVVFAEESTGTVRLIVAGALEPSMLQALESYIDRQRNRLAASNIATLVAPLGPWRLWI